MGAFENHCSEMSKQDLIDMLGRALDAKRELIEALVRIERGCAFPDDDVQRAIREVARTTLAKVKP
jgi:hypothetical protein